MKKKNNQNSIEIELNYSFHELYFKHQIKFEF